jgi:hypothetical protein
MALEFRVNAIAPLALVEAFADKVAASEMKVVALQSSRMGSIADNGSGGGYGYRGSKAALNAIGKSLSLDLADRGIVVLILHPGWVRTDMGGPNGQLTVQESVEGQLDLIARAYGNPAMSGRFFHVSGQDLPYQGRSCCGGLFADMLGEEGFQGAIDFPAHLCARQPVVAIVNGHKFHILVFMAQGPLHDLALREGHDAVVPAMDQQDGGPGILGEIGGRDGPHGVCE